MDARQILKRCPNDNTLYNSLQSEGGNCPKCHAIAKDFKEIIKKYQKKKK